MRIYRGYQFRIYPTEEQKLLFRKVFSAVHFTYNELLKEWCLDPEVDLRFALEHRLTRTYPWLAFLDRSILWYTVRRLETACRQNLQQYGAFSSEDLIQSDNRSDNMSPACTRPLPRRKTRKDSYSSFTLSAYGGDIYIRNGKLHLGSPDRFGGIRIAQSRPIPTDAVVVAATISLRPSGQYHVSILCLRTINPNLPRRLRTCVGLDYSLQSFFVASDPTLMPDEAFLHRWSASRQKLAAAQKRLSTLHPHSHNYEKQRHRIAVLHEDIANQRKDYQHKLSTLIAERYDIVCVETLDMIEMEQHSHSYARSIQDNGWSEFVQMLSYKLEERGKLLIKIGKWYPSSKRCHECGYIYHELTITQREWICPVCGARHDRDYNASLNIRDEGLRILKTSASIRDRSNAFYDGRQEYLTAADEMDPPNWDAPFYVTKEEDSLYPTTVRNAGAAGHFTGGEVVIRPTTLRSSV